ncbi:MAG: hypothetical protein K1X83_06720 [Oligoflexia bacterium]|nr:hypothetical protein [Oligoflexia bacterium]
MRRSIRVTFLLCLCLWNALASATPASTPTATPSPAPDSIATAAPALDFGRTLGTLLVFPIFDIRTQTATQLRITNYGFTDVTFHYNYVCPGVPHVTDFCAKLDRTIDLTPHETRIIDVAAQHPPCNQGFVVGYPVNGRNRPISYNLLSGSYRITNGRRVDQDDAVAIRSVRSKGEVLGSSEGFSFVNGPNQDFTPLAPLVTSDFRATETDTEGTAGSKLVLLDLGAALGMQNPISSVFVDFWSSSEVPFSSSLQFICWTEAMLESVDNNFRVDNLGTRYGSLQAASALTCPVPGGCPPIQPRAPLLIGVIKEYGPDTSGTRGLQYVPCRDGSFDQFQGCVANATPTSEATPTATDTPTNTPTDTPTNTPIAPTNTPTDTPTNTPVPPTNTPTNTPTNSPVPPTNTPTNTPTNSPVPLTNTPTSTPTNTPVAPTATPTATPTNTPFCFPADNQGSNSPNGCACIGTFDCCGICSATGFCTGANRPPNPPGDPGADSTC